MKKFLIFMLLFVNLQIVVTKCGIEIGIQSAMAQDSGKESSIVGKYSCEAIDEMGNPMIVYTDLPCQYLDDRKCSNCGRLFSTLGERKTHEASCGSQQEDKEFEKELDDLMEAIDKLGIDATALAAMLDHFNFGILNRTGEIRSYSNDIAQPFKGNQYTTMMSSGVKSAIQGFCEEAGGLAAGLNLLYQAYLGYQQDQAEGGDSYWNTFSGVMGGAGAWIGGDIGAALGAGAGVEGGPAGSLMMGVAGGMAGSDVGDKAGRELVNIIRDISK